MVNLNNIKTVRGDKIMKSKLLPTIHRIIVILTFISGTVMMFWLIKFMLIVVDNVDIQTPEAAANLGHMGESFLLFLFMIGLSFVFSLICFKASSVVESVCRTIFTAIAGGVCVPAINVMLFYIDLKKYYINGQQTVEYVTNVGLRDSDIYCSFIPMLSFAIMLVMFITSILALIMGPVLNEKVSDQIIDDDIENDDKKSRKKSKKKKSKKKNKKKGKDSDDDGEEEDSKKSKKKRKSKK